MKLQFFSKVLIIAYFLNLILNSFFSLLNLEGYEMFFRFIRIPILAILYYFTSSKKQIIYFIGLLFYQIATVFFASTITTFFIFGSVASVLFKFCLVLLVYDTIVPKNKLATGIAIVPFFIIYLYLISFVFEALSGTYYLWIINAFLTSVMGGIAIINYINTPEEKEYWLLLSAIFFIIQIGAYFINRFYMKYEAIHQIVILLYGISHFTFYRFLILKEGAKK